VFGSEVHPIRGTPYQRSTCLAMLTHECPVPVSELTPSSRTPSSRSGNGQATEPGATVNDKLSRCFGIFFVLAHTLLCLLGLCTNGQHLFLLNCRKESWRYTPSKDHVGVGAYFECMQVLKQGGSARTRVTKSKSNVDYASKSLLPSGNNAKIQTENPKP
jgi:hypothetical protein